MEMFRWADYLISMVKYDESKTRIVSVEVREDLGNAVSYKPEIISRESLLQRIEHKKRYMTVIENSNGSWSKGKKVEVILVNEQKFLKTLNDGIAKDYLEGVPEF